MRMPIGRFAAAVRLSVKALRHYDELGLLVPAFVDPQTGYRYYQRSQARTAVMIAMLRALDVPLATVRAALAASPAELKRLLDAETDRMARELSRRQQAIRSLERIARDGSLAPYAVAIRQAPALHVAKRTITTRAESLVPDSTDAVYALFERLREAGVVWRDPVLCINEDPDARGRIRVHACAALAEQMPIASREPRTPGIARDTLPGGTFACLVHEGPYEELGLAHHALHAWVQERGYEPVGPPREIYENDPAATPADALRTQVWLPLRA